MISPNSFGFLISDLFSTNRTNNLIDIQTYVEPSKLDEVQFGVYVADNAYNKFNTKFEINSQVKPKVDLIALTSTDSLERINNYGLIFFQNNSFLFDKEKENILDKELVARTVIHEVNFSLLT